MRIAVLSDIHSNLVALDAVLAHAGSVDAVWHLGDVVGYGPDPDAVVDRLSAVGAVGVRGNHDAAALGGDEIELVQPGGPGGHGVDPAADLATTTRTWLRGLPERRIEGDFTLVHGSPRDPTWEYVTTAALARGEPGGASRPRTACTATPTSRSPSLGADGRMRTRRAAATATPSALDERRALLNPGSVGQPRDGDPRASYLHPRPRRADGDLASRRRTTSTRSRPRCGPPACRTASPSGSATASESRADDRRPTAAPGPQARRPAGPRRAPARAVLPLHRARAS